MLYYLVCFFQEVVNLSYGVCAAEGFGVVGFEKGVEDWSDAGHCTDEQGRDQRRVGRRVHSPIETWTGVSGELWNE